MEIKRGEVFYADLSPVIGSEQGGTRPVVIVQNDVGNRHSPTVIAAAITSKQDKSVLPTHIAIKGSSCGLAVDSVVLLEQIRTIDKKRRKEKTNGCPSLKNIPRNGGANANPASTSRFCAPIFQIQ